MTLLVHERLSARATLFDVGCWVEESLWTCAHRRVEPTRYPTIANIFTLHWRIEISRSLTHSHEEFPDDLQSEFNDVG